MKLSIVFVLRVEPHSPTDPPTYVSDICGHAYGTEYWLYQAKEWSSEAELLAELHSSEIEGDFEIVKIVRCQD